jgi:MFS family permease
MRPLAVAVLVNTAGTGQLTAGLALFLVASAHVSSGYVAVLLSVAGAAGLLGSLPAGRLADRWGARRMTRIMMLVRAVASLLFLTTHSLPVLIAITAVAMIADRGANVATSALIARVGGPERVRVRAYLRSVANLGVTLGAAFAGIAVGVNTRLSYTVMLGSVAVLVTVGSAVLGRLPQAPVAARPTATRPWAALRDWRYLAITGLHGVLSLHFDVLAVLLPLWVLHLRIVPMWTVSVFIVVNTAIVTLFQVSASRGVDTVSRAARVGRRAGATFLLSAVLFGVTDRIAGPSILLTAILILGVVVQSVGELWQTASSFTLSFDLAAEHAQGQYQAVFGLGRGVVKALAPVLLSALCLGLGVLGWCLLGIGLLGTGLLLGRLIPEDAP